MILRAEIGAITLSKIISQPIVPNWSGAEKPKPIEWLYVAPAAVMLWILRIWLLSHRAELDDDPVAFALRDPLSWALGVAVAAAIALAI